MKFMVCYDGSDEAKEALTVAQQHASVWNAKLEVVHAIVRVEPLKHSQVERAEEKLEQEVKDFFKDEGSNYEAQLLLTDLTPGEQLVQFAEDDKIDQIFLGIQKKSKVGKLFFGSTAQYIILHAPCPVISIQKSA